VTYKKPYEDNIVFVTAAEKNYFNQLILLINSYYKHINNKFIVYDIGLDKKQSRYLEDNHKNIILRKFQFDQYPKFMGEYVDGKLGDYAWKPVIINEVLLESKSKVVWLDAGNLITRKIRFLKIALTTNRIIVPSSSNTIKKWTHPKTIEYIGIQNNILNKKNFASGLIGFDYNSKEARLVSELWSKFSQIQECISPKGSSRLNHRQDQAVLTLLLYKYFFKGSFKRLLHPQTNFIFGVLFHKRKIYNF
tara:strand:- start:1598 stop:2344 length:747 start_codon:yes stop_codon:yes gene_type:complete